MRWLLLSLILVVVGCSQSMVSYTQAQHQIIAGNEEEFDRQIRLFAKNNDLNDEEDILILKKLLEPMLQEQNRKDLLWLEQNFHRMQPPSFGNRLGNAFAGMGQAAQQQQYDSFYQLDQFQQKMQMDELNRNLRGIQHELWRQNWMNSPEMQAIRERARLKQLRGY